MSNIHSTAIISPSAQLADDVTVGPYSIIGPQVEINSATWIGPHVVINGPTKIGKNNKIFQFASVGEAPQDLSYQGEDTRLEIGDNNIIRENCTIHRGTIKDKRITKIGNNNLFMAYVHVAHDCVIGNHTIFANNASLTGHVTVDDYAFIGGFCGVHQFCRIGSYSFISRVAMVPKNIPPYVLVAGPGCNIRGLNTVGLERHGFSSDAISQLKRAYKIFHREQCSLQEAIAKLEKLAVNSKEVKVLLDFIHNASDRGIMR